MCLCVIVCAQMCGCTVVCELWYLNVCKRGLEVMRAHIFLNFIFLLIREKDELNILSLESVTSIKKAVNQLKVVHHPVSCLLHHYIHNNKCKDQVILLMITDGKNWHCLAVKSLSALLRVVTSNYNGDFCCLNCFHLNSTKNRLKKHDRVCNDHDYCYVEMPNE